MNKEAYERIIAALLKRWKSILGGGTVYQHTYDVKGLAVTPLGDFLKLDADDGYPVLEDLIKRFESISGLVAIGISHEAVQDLLRIYPKLKVPDKLKEGKSAAEAFLKSI